MADLRFEYETIQAVMDACEQTRVEAETLAGYMILHSGSEDPLMDRHEEIRNRESSCAIESIDLLSHTRNGAQTVYTNFKEADRAGSGNSAEGAGG